MRVREALKVMTNLMFWADHLDGDGVVWATLLSGVQQAGGSSRRGAARLPRTNAAAVVCSEEP